MSTQAWRTGHAADRLRIRAKLPLYRNGYALIASSAVTSALGLVYWTVAARLYDARAIGVSAALIAAVTLLANLAQLNLKSALNRFLPTAGAGAGRLVLSAYALAVAVAMVTGAVFLAGLPVWSPELAWLLDRPALALWFVAATVTWTIFVLQDGALAGLRQALWVPAENATFAVAKILLLLALAATMPTLGVFVSWTAPILVLIVPVLSLIHI